MVWTRPGLDEMDRRLLRVIIEHFDGGPSRFSTRSAPRWQNRVTTIEDVTSPF